MSETFLTKIVRETRVKVASQKSKTDLTSLRDRAMEQRANSEPHRLADALSQKDRTNIIAEIKRASPSKGIINDMIDVGEMAGKYESGGAAAISVLTEPVYFKGSLDDLVAARSAVKIPILRKDFTVDEFQIYEAAAAGADAILLIVAALAIEDLVHFLKLAREDLGMDALVEIHDSKELGTAADIGANIIGVNNRNLHSLEVSLDTSRKLISERPESGLLVAESGLSTRDEITELRSLGFDGFLIGESLMRTVNVTETLGGWV